MIQREREKRGGEKETQRERERNQSTSQAERRKLIFDTNIEFKDKQSKPEEHETFKRNGNQTNFDATERNVLSKREKRNERERGEVVDE